MYNINLNYLFNNIHLTKIYIFKLLNYYIKVLFNMHNLLSFYKSNNFILRKQKNFVEDADYCYNYSFTQTVNVRHLQFFRHYTYHMNFFRSLYLFDIYNYFYFIKKIEFNVQYLYLYLMLKYDLYYYYLALYLIIYLIIIIFLYYYFKNFYDFIFFCKAGKNYDLQSNWEKNFNDKSIQLSKNFNKR